MKLNEVARVRPNDELKRALEYLAGHPEYYSTSRDILSMLHGWFKHEPEITAYIDKILARTKEKDMKALGF
jgi:hypothetical protein